MGREAAESSESAGKAVRSHKVAEMRSQLIVAFLAVSLHGRLFDRAVHPLDLAISGAYVDLAPTPAGRALSMAVTFAIVAPTSNGAWLIAGHALNRLMTQDGTRRIALLSMALLLVVSAALIAFG